MVQKNQEFPPDFKLSHASFFLHIRPSIMSITLINSTHYCIANAHKTHSFTHMLRHVFNQRSCIFNDVFLFNNLMSIFHMNLILSMCHWSKTVKIQTIREYFGFFQLTNSVDLSFVKHQNFRLTILGSIALNLGFSVHIQASSFDVERYHKADVFMSSLAKNQYAILPSGIYKM